MSQPFHSAPGGHPTERELFALLRQCGHVGREGEVYTHRAYCNTSRGTISHRFQLVSAACTHYEHQSILSAIENGYVRTWEWGQGWNNSVPMNCPCVIVRGKALYPLTREDALAACPAPTLTEADRNREYEARYESW